MLYAKAKIKVFKIGGKVVNDENLLSEFIDQFAAIKNKKILVHGGGNKASEILTKMGIDVKMVEGRRITYTDTLDVVTMVYGGLVNKNMVAQLQAKGVNAIGLSGADGNVIKSHKRIVKEIDYGYAGDIDEVSCENLIKLISAGFVPVLCPLTHDKKGQLLNTNADTIAGAVAVALAANYSVELKFCFELKGVLKHVESKDSLIPILKEADIDQLHKKGIIQDGMIPKLKNGFDALREGVHSVSICHVTEMKNDNSGTQLAL